MVSMHWWRVVQDLHTDNLWFGEPVDYHGGRQHQRQQAQCQGLPCFQRDYGDRDRDQYCGLELQAQEERNDDFTDETTAWNLL